MRVGADAWLDDAVPQAHQALDLGRTVDRAVDKPGLGRGAQNDGRAQGTVTGGVNQPMQQVGTEQLPCPKVR